MGDATITPANAGFLQKNLETISACNSDAYWINPFCWGYSPSAWAQMAQFASQSITTMPVAPAAIPAAYTTVAPTTDEAAQQTSDVLNAAMLQTQANNLAASQDQPTVCDSGQVLADDGVTCVSTGTNWAIWAALAAAGVFAVVALGGSPRQGYGR